MFNDPGGNLEQILILHVGASKQLGDFRVRAGLDIGGDFNSPIVFTPNVPNSNEPPLLKPLAGNNLLILGIEIGVRYTYSQGPDQEPK